MIAHYSSSLKTGNLADAIAGTRTFALHPRACFVKTRDGDFAFGVRTNLDGAIAEVFTSAGYQSSAHTSADRTIAYAIGQSAQLPDQQLTKIFGIAPGGSATNADRRGSLVLVVLDSNEHVLFRTAATGPINDGPDRNDAAQREGILATVRTLLAELPQRTR